MKIVSSFGERLNEALKLREYDSNKLASLTGINVSLIYRYQKNLVKPKNDKIQLIAKALSVNELWLIGYQTHYEVNTTDKIELRRDIDHILNNLSKDNLNKVLVFLETFFVEGNNISDE